MEAAKMQDQTMDDVVEFEIDDLAELIEDLAKYKVALEDQLKKQQTACGEIDWEDGWSVSRANFSSWRGEAMNGFFRNYLDVSYQLECLARAKKIAEADDSIEIVEFSGGYTGGPNVRVFLDHDNGRVMLVD